MKRLMVVGGIAAVLLSAVAAQHSPPGVDQSTVDNAPLALVAPSFEPTPTLYLRVTNVAAVDNVIALSASLSNRHVVLPKAVRPSWRRSTVALYLLNAQTRHVSNTAMRGWGFL